MGGGLGVEQYHQYAKSKNENKSLIQGSTPLNKLSIGIHTNIVLRNRHSTPHVTIF